MRDNRKGKWEWSRTKSPTRGKSNLFENWCLVNWRSLFYLKIFLYIRRVVIFFLKISHFYASTVQRELHRVCIQECWELLLIKTITTIVYVTRQDSLKIFNLLVNQFVVVSMLNQKFYLVTTSPMAELFFSFLGAIILK